MGSPSGTDTDRSIISGNGGAERTTPYTGLVGIPLLAIGPAPLELDALIAAVSDRGEGTGSDGAVTTFLGLVRNHNVGRRVHHLEYEAYEPLALRTFERIDAEIRERWPEVRLALHHRIGRIDIGGASVAIAAASPHRGHAFSACRYAIERVKQIAPIWKREFFEGGDVWIEGATADPDDAAALAHAERIACV
jgi:molybdopterin synthase catalytic subunit